MKRLCLESCGSTSPTLWVGTNSGLVLVLQLCIPNMLDTRQEQGVQAGEGSQS